MFLFQDIETIGLGRQFPTIFLISSNLYVEFIFYKQNTLKASDAVKTSGIELFMFEIILPSKPVTGN